MWVNGKIRKSLDKFFMKVAEHEHEEWTPYNGEMHMQGIKVICFLTIIRNKSNKFPPNNYQEIGNKTYHFTIIKEINTTTFYVGYCKQSHAKEN